MNSSNNNYDTNFTAGGILLNEFLAIKDILLSSDIEQKLRNEIEDNKIIGIGTKGARQRIILEIIRRVNAVPKTFWVFFYGLSLTEQKQALFYLCLKTYSIVFDLHFDVAVKKFKTSGTLIDYDVQMYLDEIASLNKNVANWSDKTLKKINSQYRTVLKDIGLLKDDSLNKSYIQSRIFWDYFKENGDRWFLTACFIEN